MTVLKGPFSREWVRTLNGRFVGYKVDDFVTMPATMAHFAARAGHRRQVHGIGPFSLTYVHPQDDPTK